MIDREFYIERNIISIKAIIKYNDNRIIEIYSDNFSDLLYKVKEFLPNNKYLEFEQYIFDKYI